MNEKEILEGNKLIAEFMGGKFIESDPMYYSGMRSFFYFKDKPNIPYSDMRWHYSWDWLMPVVEKIKKYWFCDEDEADKVCSLYVATCIEDVWKAVVKFIKWYNQGELKSC